jgi:hypothetical protein
MTSKYELCVRFAKNPGDDIYQIVEELVDLRTESCPCAYPSTKPCPRTADAPNCIGLCTPHMKTKRGVELANLWNKTLEDLDIQESEEVEESQTSESSSEQDESEHSEEVKTPNKSAPPPVVTIPTPAPPTKPVRQPRTPTPALPTKVTAPNITVEKPPRVRKPKPVAVSEEESAAEGSAKAVYVEQEEEESPKPPLVFKMGKFNNYVNEEHKFVLRLNDKTVLGTENKTGGIVKLTPKQIAVCKEHNLNYLE